MWRGRIPLTALRSFEVAGRLENFTLAAAELFVSQAAISRQVRELETRLGTKLFYAITGKLSLLSLGKSCFQFLPSLLMRLIIVCQNCLKSRKNLNLLLTLSRPLLRAGWFQSL